MSMGGIWVTPDATETVYDTSLPLLQEIADTYPRFSFVQPQIFNYFVLKIVATAMMSLGCQSRRWKLDRWTTASS